MPDEEFDNNGNQISMLVSTIATANVSAGLGLAQPGVDTEDEVTFEISAYDAFGRLVSVQNDNYTAEYAYCCVKPFRLYIS